MELKPPRGAEAKRRWPSRSSAGRRCRKNRRWRKPRAPKASPLKTAPADCGKGDQRAEAMAPLPSQSAVNWAKREQGADVNKPPVDEVKPVAPQVAAKTEDHGLLPTAEKERTKVELVPASGTAPPTLEAPKDHKSIVDAPKLPLPAAAVIAPPPPAVEAEHKPVAKVETRLFRRRRRPQRRRSFPARAHPGCNGRCPRAGSRPYRGQPRPADAIGFGSVFQGLDQRGNARREGCGSRRPPGSASRRPLLLPAAWAAIVSSPNPSVVLLLVQIDETGKVINVKVKAAVPAARSSTCHSLIPDHGVWKWWFEPTKGQGWPSQRRDHIHS